MIKHFICFNEINSVYIVFETITFWTMSLVKAWSRGTGICGDVSHSQLASIVTCVMMKSLAYAINIAKRFALFFLLCVDMNNPFPFCRLVVYGIAIEASYNYMYYTSIKRHNCVKYIMYNFFLSIRYILGPNFDLECPSLHYPILIWSIKKGLQREIFNNVIPKH